jgi:magnesium-protoporphyrin IX monomethyl ester (oxidative) cyclase
MDVLLINPVNIKSRPFGITPPLGLAFIGCELEKKRFSVKILDMEIMPLDFDLFAYIKNLAPKIVGISGTSHSRFESFKIANITKQVSSEIFTVYGGCHATFTAEDTLLHIKDIDYIVHGEGEITFPELVNFLISRQGNIENIKGISFRKDGNVVRNAPRERITDLDSLSYSRHLLEMEKYDIKMSFSDLPATTIMTARGCPYNCSFCSASTMFGKTYTRRSAKKIVEEIRYYIKRYKIKGVRFFDSTLTLNSEHIVSLVNELKAENLNFSWSCEIRVNTVDRPLLEAMREAGCYYVDFGVESLSENVLQKIGKQITLQQVVGMLKWCRELDIKTTVFFSFGHIGETWDDTQKTLSFIDKYFDYMTNSSEIFGIRVYPGTRVEKYARENGLLPDNFSWSAPFKNIEEGPVTTDNVPILLQPRYGIKELQKCYAEVEKIRSKKLLHIKSILEKWRQIGSLSDLLQKISTMFKLIKKALFS